MIPNLFFFNGPLLIGFSPGYRQHPMSSLCRRIRARVLKVGLHWEPLVLSHISCVQLFVTPWTLAFQAPLPMRFSRKEYWSGLLFHFPGAQGLNLHLLNCKSMGPPPLHLQAAFRGPGETPKACQPPGPTLFIHLSSDSGPGLGTAWASAGSDQNR